MVLKRLKITNIDKVLGNGKMELQAQGEVCVYPHFSHTFCLQTGAPGRGAESRPGACGGVCNAWLEREANTALSLGSPSHSTSFPVIAAGNLCLQDLWASSSNNVPGKWLHSILCHPQTCKTFVSRGI